MIEEKIPTEEQLDYLTEMLSIGIGNAAAAFAQLIGENVDVAVPEVHVIKIPNLPTVFDDLSLPVTCMRLGIVGHANGNLFFLVPEEHTATLTELANHTMFEMYIEYKRYNEYKSDEEWSASLLADLANVVSGVFLAAINEFCKLKMFHTVPVASKKTLGSVLEDISRLPNGGVTVLIKTVFTVSNHRIVTYYLIVPYAKSLDALLNSIKAAKKNLGYDE